MLISQLDRYGTRKSSPAAQIGQPGASSPAKTPHSDTEQSRVRGLLCNTPDMSSGRRFLLRIGQAVVATLAAISSNHQLGRAGRAPVSYRV